MHKTGLRLLAVISAGIVSLTMTAFAAPASARVADAGAVCVEQEADTASSARGGRALDHRGISRVEQERIAKKTDRRLAGRSSGAAITAATIPVYVHVMRSKSGAGDVTNAQIASQIDVLNATFGGAESSAAAATGFTFTLAGTDRFNNNTWHRDGSSTKYRTQTRRGGANALNIWLVDFNYLGIATFPWDYSSKPGIDGIRVQYTSLPGGSATNYDRGETATHEAGHWLGLYHTFQGGCTPTNDEVRDTPAQSTPTNGCPAGADTCSLPGLDPIHNYMDYSYDSCYNQFTVDQSTRSSQMFTAYRS